MAFSLVDSTIGQGNANSATSAAIDTTGADLLVVAVAEYQGGIHVTVTDSKSNTWNQLTTEESGDTQVTIWYATSPTVGASHTFTASGSQSYAVVMACAYSGVAASPFDQENGASTGGATSLQPGSVTPTEDNELLVSGLCLDGVGSSIGINSSFTVQENLEYAVGDNMGGAIADKIQTTAGAENPTWSWTTSVGGSAVIATFKAASAGGGSILPLLNHYISGYKVTGNRRTTHIGEGLNLK